MKVNFFNPSFKGVVLVGSTPQQKSNTISQVQENIKLAKTIADSFNEKGEDTYVVGFSPLDARGNKTDRLNTYVLYGEDAKVVNKFGEIKTQLVNLFKGGAHSDLFDEYLNRNLMKLTQEQSKTAQFIAENRLGLEKSDFPY